MTIYHVDLLKGEEPRNKGTSSTDLQDCVDKNLVAHVEALIRDASTIPKAKAIDLTTADSARKALQELEDRQKLLNEFSKRTQALHALLEERRFQLNSQTKKS